MISIFRKIRQQLIANRRFRDYLLYAIGEILLVVIGILIALQINLSKENRADRVKEEFYLQGLRKDMIFNRSELNRVLKKSKRQELQADSLIAYVYGDSSPIESGYIDSLIVDLSGYTIFTPTNGTIREIIGSGNLELIRNQEIREKVATWDSGLDWIQSWELFYKSNFDDYAELTKSNLEFHDYIVQGRFSKDQRDELFDNLKFRNLLIDLSGLSERLHEIYQAKDQEIDSLLILIDAELK